MAEKKRGSGWSDIPDSPNQNKYDKDFDRFSFPDGDWAQIRLIGNVYDYNVHWVPAVKKQNESLTAYPMPCRKNIDSKKPCPLCQAGIKRQTVYLSNAIIRDLQEDKPERIKGPPAGTEFRKAGDKWWSPVRVIQFPFGVAQSIKNISALNKAKTKDGIKVFSLEHPKYGRDLNILLDKNQSGSGMYNIQKEDKSPLSDEEKEYLLYNLELIYDYIPDVNDMLEALRGSYDKDALSSENCDIKVVKALLRGAESSHTDDDDDDDEDEAPKSKKSSKKDDSRGSKKSSKKRDDEDDDDLDDDLDSELDDEDEDEEEKPKSKKGSKSKKSSKKDDDDDDLDDEDEDEKPKSKKKGKSAKKSKDDLDDDDLDDDLDSELDDDDLDDDEDEKPKSKKGKADKSKKKSKDDDDLEDDLDDDDEDEKPKQKAKGKSAKKSSKKDDDDDDDDLDSDDLDDEEEEEEKPKRKKRR